MTKEMAPPSLPIVRMQTGELQYNELHGMVGTTDITFQRDTLTVLGANRQLDFGVELFDSHINKLAIEVRSCDGSRLIENTEIQDYQLVKHTIQVNTSVKDLIEPDTEYALIVVITDENDREIRYYTRMIWSEKLYAAEKLAFVKELKNAGVNVPVMIAGATTSPLHTALKIAPAYDGAVVHVKDVSQNVVVAAELLGGSERYCAFVTALKSGQEELRAQAAAKGRAQLRSLDEARANKLNLFD